MKTSVELAEEVREKEADLSAREKRVHRLAEAIETTRRRRDRALVLLELDLDGRPLSLMPLLSAVVAVCASLAAALCAYATLLGGERPWILGGLSAVVLAFVAGASAQNPGAGGAARARLRAIALSVTVLAAVFLVMGIGIHVGH